jgi:hypothetical protein
MVNSQVDASFRRREVFRFAAVTGFAFWAESYAFAASDFWNKKKPSEWTEQEIQELRTKSPWAKKVDADITAGGGRGAGGGGGGGRGGGGGGGGGFGGGGGGDEGGGGGGRGGGGGGGGRGGGGGVAPAAGGGGQSVSLEVVWQSAKPIQDSHPIALPAKLDNHYVVAVTGIPMPILNATMMGRGGGRGFSGGGGGRRYGGGRDGGGGGQDQANAGPPPESADAGNGAAGPPPTPPDPTAGLKRGTTLTVKGKSPQNADVVMSMNNNSTILFGFAKDALALAVADKDVEFDLKLAGLSGKAKFTLKDMMYHEELAL